MNKQSGLVLAVGINGMGIMIFSNIPVSIMPFAMDFTPNHFGVYSYLFSNISN
jgi:hypothetical protein